MFSESSPFFQPPIPAPQEIITPEPKLSLTPYKKMERTVEKPLPSTIFNEPEEPNAKHLNTKLQNTRKHVTFKVTSPVHHKYLTSKNIKKPSKKLFKPSVVTSTIVKPVDLEIENKRLETKIKANSPSKELIRDSVIAPAVKVIKVQNRDENFNSTVPREPISPDALQSTLTLNKLENPEMCSSLKILERINNLENGPQNISRVVSEKISNDEELQNRIVKKVSHFISRRVSMFFWFKFVDFLIFL